MPPLESSQGPLSVSRGQAASASAAGGASTGAAPGAGDGQTGGQNQSQTLQQGQAQVQSQGQEQGQARGNPAGEAVFFDPTTLPAELMPAYKQMQAAFTRKSQDISKERQKVEAYNAFMTDPIGNLQRMATQYGYSLSKGEARTLLNNQQPGAAQNGQQGQAYQPQSWDEVFERATTIAQERIMQQMSPLFQNVQQLHAQTVERQLDDIDPGWRVHEDAMRENMRLHPTLVNDVGKLYRLSVPEEVLASKATQSALKKLDGTVKAAQVSGSGQTSRTSSAPQTVKTFDDAVAEARRQLSQRR